MFTEEQKGVVAKWLKAHGKSKAPKAQFEDYWSLFEKSATRELVGEFNSAAGEGGVQISRTKRAMTKGVEEGIDQVNAQYEDEEASQSESSDDGGWTSVQETKVEAKIGKEEKKNPMSGMMKIMPLMTLAFSFMVPSGLGLYWALGNIFGIIQLILIKKVFVSKKKEGSVINV